MTINTKMPTTLKPFFDQEIASYNTCMNVGQFPIAWKHLERAHVIGQRYPFAHSYAHWKMLKFGFRIKNTKEILGQIPRLIIGGVKSFVGKVPVGNTGGANIPPLMSLPITQDIQEMFAKAGVK